MSDMKKNNIGPFDKKLIDHYYNVYKSVDKNL